MYFLETLNIKTDASGGFVESQGVSSDSHKSHDSRKWFTQVGADFIKMTYFVQQFIFQISVWRQKRRDKKEKQQILTI